MEQRFLDVLGDLKPQTLFTPAEDSTFLISVYVIGTKATAKLTWHDGVSANDRFFYPGAGHGGLQAVRAIGGNPVILSTENSVGPHSVYVTAQRLG